MSRHGWPVNIFVPARTDGGSLSCPICQYPASVLFQKNGYPIVQCCNCRFLWVSPSPSDDVIAAHYRDSYRGATAQFYPKDRSRRWRAFWRALRLASFVRNLDVVDLGCGGGQMLAALCRFARSGVGVDLSENSIAFARKHFPRQEFFAEGLREFARRRRRFDFVFSSELIEHLRSPDEFIDTVRTITRPGGMVYLSAPDAGHPKTPTDLSQWADICPPEHLQWFNATNLAMLFDQNGFAPAKRERTSKPAHSVFFRKIG